MSDPLIDALTQSIQLDQSTNPWLTAGRGIQNAQIDWEPEDDPLMRIATSFGQGLFGGLANNYGTSQVRDNLIKRSGRIGDLQDSFGMDGLPDALEKEEDPILAALAPTLRFDSISRKRSDEADLAKRERDLEFDLLADKGKAKNKFSNELMLAVIKDRPELLTDEVREQLGLKRSDALVDALAPEAVEQSPLLAPGNRPTAEKISRYFEQFRREGMPATQAAAAARAQVEGEVKANASSFDEAKKSREYAEQLLTMAQTARAGMAQAGKTGSMPGVRSALDQVGAFFGSDNSQKRITGDQVLTSIAPELVKMFRSPGGVTDYETRMLLGSGPSVQNTPEANELLVGKMEELAKLNMDYADFLESYRDANGGSTRGADKKWSEYRRNIPLIITDPASGEALVNRDRMDWREFFARAGGAEFDDELPEKTSDNNQDFETALGGDDEPRAQKPQTKLKASELIAKGYTKTPEGWKRNISRGNRG
jgi:hypothetical protein